VLCVAGAAAEQKLAAATQSLRGQHGNVADNSGKSGSSDHRPGTQ
jgi:hypothetical protein